MIWNDGQWGSPDPIADRVRDERDEYETSLDDDLAMSMWDPQSGWIDA